MLSYVLSGGWLENQYRVKIGTGYESGTDLVKIPVSVKISCT